MMTPAKPRDLPNTFYGFLCHTLDVLISKEGVVATLLVGIIFSGAWASLRGVEIVGPDAANWLRTSADSTAALKDTVVLLARNMEANTQRIDQQDRRLSIMEEKLDADLVLAKSLIATGSEPARQLVEEFKAARKDMAPAVESRERTEAILGEIRDALRKHPDGAATIFDRRTTGGERSTIKNVDKEPTTKAYGS